MSIGTYGPLSTWLRYARARRAARGRRRSRPGRSWPAAAHDSSVSGPGHERQRHVTGREAAAAGEPAQPAGRRRSPSRNAGPDLAVGRGGGVGRDAPDPRDVQRLAQRRAVRPRARPRRGGSRSSATRSPLSGSRSSISTGKTPGVRSPRGIGQPEPARCRAGAFGSWSRRVRTRPPAGAIGSDSPRRTPLATVEPSRSPSMRALERRCGWSSTSARSPGLRARRSGR